MLYCFSQSIVHSSQGHFYLSNPQRLVMWKLPGLFNPSLKKETTDRIQTRNRQDIKRTGYNKRIGVTITTDIQQTKSNRLKTTGEEQSSLKTSHYSNICHISLLRLIASWITISKKHKIWMGYDENKFTFPSSRTHSQCFRPAGLAAGTRRVTGVSSSRPAALQGPHL